MRKVLILTVTAGGGHNACASAVKDALEAVGGTEVKILDLLKSCSSGLNAWIADRGYSLAVSRLPRLYDAFFNYYKKAPSENRYKCAAQGVAVSTVHGLLKEILSFKPDVIYCTHFYGAIALTDLGLVYRLPCKTVFSVLDFVNSPFLEAGVGVDFVTLPDENFIPEFIAEGYVSKKLIPLGRPVDGRTLELTSKARAREALGLNADYFTVLVAFGGGSWSGGLKIFKSAVKALKGRRAQIIMINGKDARGYKKISKMKSESGIKVVNIGFTKDMPKYLAAADIFLGKCGGGTATEAVNAGVPMIITEKIPAQEKYNLLYLKSKGVALSFKNARKLKEKLTYFIDNPRAAEEVRERALKLRKNAVGDLVKLITSQPQADYIGFTAGDLSENRLKKRVKTALKYADIYEKRPAEYFIND